ncbi:MAG: DUF523 domain-containing protein [Sulfurospirillum sp.]
MSKKVLISSCLLGENVKYDGGNNYISQNPFIEKLKSQNLIVPTCPEVEGGLPIPRVVVEIKDAKAINKNGVDKTKEFEKGAQKAFGKVKLFDIKMAIMKSKSPSCGRDFIYDGSFTKKLIEGDGVSVKLLKMGGIRIFTENEITEAREFWEKL